MKILALCWRDPTHPQGGGSERYLHEVARYLHIHGHEVIYRSAAVAGQPATTRRAGVIHHRFGGKYTVYIRAVLAMVAGRFGIGPYRDVDAVIDTQNGIPFFAQLALGKPTIVLTHHCHQQQWPVAGPVLARIGWWLESQVSPRVHRHTQYVTVSAPSKAELVALGVDAHRIAIIRNGVDVSRMAEQLPLPAVDDRPLQLVCVARLVPHKQIEDALWVVQQLATQQPVQLTVVGEGWWHERLCAAADELGVAQVVRFTGFIPEAEKHAILQASDVHIMPSKKEGWGLAVTEAAMHAVPTVGYRYSGGLQDSVIDGETGLLVDTREELLDAVQTLAAHPDYRHRLGVAARNRARQFSWEETGARFLALLQRTVTRSGHLL
ncbi:glycosyltransferase family 4 protein [Corynebacterium choanae]|uniref:GDP-mannose-dependent alpha-(1-6)-phosphatidylinositol monomannoside mannosyltransferase n=1 Tax=Corynebacterium choanae TaxID=1862358 RepID=A0A3G6J3U4_9CORY|nr:glycosyltransferase family 4 protein [Corynebacterium choanae]AZA12602.1 GDP-mannose-dependent alpha-(1-6)-phosphatidylinositol monomannoside mannosyltransferase [Corynebacterium choanae]